MYDPSNSLHHSAGFVVAKRIERPSNSDKTLLPRKLISASGCLTSLLPSGVFIAWDSGPQEGRQDELERWGLATTDLGNLVSWMTQAHHDGSFVLPNAFTSLEAVRAFMETFALSQEDLVVLELGLHESLINEFLEDPTVDESASQYHYHRLLRSGQLLNRSVVPLGYEVLGQEHLAHFHSWLCNGLEVPVNEHLGVRPNEFGLISNFGEADRVARYCCQDEVGATPVPWYPWLLCQVPLENVMSVKPQPGA